MDKQKLDFNSEIIDDEIRTIVDREARKAPGKMDLGLIMDGLDYLHPFDEQEDDLRTKIAWSEFQSRYVVQYERHHSRIVSIRRVIIVSVLIAMTLAATVCYALGIDVFSIAIKWTREQLNMFIESNGVVEISEFDEELQYDNHVRKIWGNELCDILEENDAFIHLPSWKPLDYTLVDFGSTETSDRQCLIYAYYESNDGQGISVLVRCVSDAHAMVQFELSFETDEDLQEVYYVKSSPYYIMSNTGVNSIAWCEGTYIIIITGDVSVDDMKDIVESI